MANLFCIYIQSGNASNSGHYESAKQYGGMSLCCSLTAVAIHLIAAIIGIVAVVLLFTVGLGIIGIEAQEHL